MKMLKTLLSHCSAQHLFTLVQADLIPRLINSLNPQSLSFEEAVDIRTFLISTIADSVHLSTTYGLERLEIEDGHEQQSVHETVFQQVVGHSEQYINHLCVNRCSIIDGDQSQLFLDLLTNLIRISATYQPMMDFVLHMPVVLAIPSCLTFFEDARTVWYFLVDMNSTQRDWNEKSGYAQQMGKIVHRMLRMEGIEDVIEETLQNNKGGFFGAFIVGSSIKLNNLLGMNLPRRE
ncbi:hypothetical protein BLNAU_20768 [Blattamonas nauphoetae]|uniref:Uncharacterized protein n=1 Tax=Blattamonas nauphoetae TaxID=2049346 RepID=A0ABQ9WYC5_9EUKA|nr:hypothetical protein BLNAU_20768 [Blattamonas nauphoetae]